MTSGHKKVFQLPTNAYSATVSKAGVDRGTTTRHRYRRWLAPSSWLASQSSFGMLRKNWRSRKMENTLTHQGTLTAVKVSNQPPRGLQMLSTGMGHGKYVRMTKLGMSVTSWGIIIVP